MLFAVAGAGVLAPIFNAVATIVPLFFPRIAIAVRPLIDRNKGGDEGAQIAAPTGEGEQTGADAPTELTETEHETDAQTNDTTNTTTKEPNDA